MRVAVTGATGFVGRRLVRLLRKKGYHVRALVRRQDPALTGEGIQTVLGALEDPAAVSEAIDGADAVVHAAGAIKAARRGTFQAVNVGGTAAVMAAVAANGKPTRLIFVSSLAAREPQLSAYAASKRAAEALVVGTPEQVRWVIIRPPVIYGPGDRATLPLFRALARGLIPVIGSKTARFSMIYVDDLAALIEALLREERRDGRIIEPDDGRAGGYSWTDVGAEAAASLGRNVRNISIPPAFLWPVAGANSALASLSGRAFMLTPGKLRELRHRDWVCHVRSADLPAGWRPRIGFKDGFGRTLVWYKRHHYI